MNKEDIIRKAREAGAIPIHRKPKEFAVVGNEAIERFAALVAAAEREACAKFLEANAELCSVMVADILCANAAAIRTRGK